MRRGDQVIHMADPLGHGLGCIVDLTRAGTVVVQWTSLDVGDYYPHELEHADRWEKQQVSAIPRDVVARIMAGVYDG